MDQAEKYECWLISEDNKRAKLLENVSALRLPCLACGKMFLVNHVSVNLLFCVPEHALGHKKHMVSAAGIRLTTFWERGEEQCGIEE